jgi:hypothetical protein
MPVLPMNDREKVVLEDSQIGFIRFVALDLFQSVNDMCEISFAVDQMQANLKKWEMRKQTTMQHDSGVSNLDDEYTNTTTGKTRTLLMRRGLLKKKVLDRTTELGSITHINRE